MGADRKGKERIENTKESGNVGKTNSHPFHCSVTRIHIWSM
jgi:hypothetical protein